MISRLFTWFYYEMPGRIFRYFKVWFLYLSDLFTLEIIFKTFFAPWRRDVVKVQNMPLKVVLQVWGMNVIARLIGMFIKTTTFITFLLAIAVWLASFSVFFVGWLGFPLIFITLVFGFYQIPIT